MGIFERITELFRGLVMELNKEFWLKVKEEYEQNYNERNKAYYEICWHSKTFKNAFHTPELRIEITNKAMLFIEGYGVKSQNYFVPISDHEYSALFSLTNNGFENYSFMIDNSLQIRKDFLGWCILNSK